MESYMSVVNGVCLVCREVNTHKSTCEVAADEYLTNLNNFTFKIGADGIIYAKFKGSKNLVYYKQNVYYFVDTNGKLECMGDSDAGIPVDLPADICDWLLES